MWEDIYIRTSGWFDNKVAESDIQWSGTYHFILIKTQLATRSVFLSSVTIFKTSNSFVSYWCIRKGPSLVKFILSYSI